MNAIRMAAVAALVLATSLVASDDVLVTVLATNDIHGALWPWDYGRNVEVPDTGLTKVATLVRARRLLDPEALLVDVGDTLQGSSLVHLVNTRPDRGLHPMVAAMNAMGYTAFVPGNHDFDYGMPLLERFAREAAFPTIAANAVDTATGDLRWPAYVVRMVRGVRVGILGLTSPGIPGWLPPKNYEGLRFLGSIDPARRYVERLRRVARCDVVVVAFHGGPENRHTDGDPSINNGYELARSVPGIDVLLLAHTHQIVPGERVGGAFVLQAGSYAHALGEVRIRLRSTNDGFRVVRVTGRVMAVTAATPPDPTVTAIVGPAHAATVAEMNQPLARVTEPMRLADAAYRDNELMDLIQRIQLDYTGAQLSLCSVFDPYMTVEDVFTVRHLFKLYPYENDLYLVQMTGAQLRAFLESAARAYTCRDGLVGTSDEFPLFNLDMLQGLSYRIDPRRPVGSRVVSLLDDGRPVPDDRVYRVAMNSYRAGGTGGYDMVRDAKILQKSDRPVRDIIADWLRRSGTVVPARDDNWRLDVEATTRFAPLTR